LLHGTARGVIKIALARTAAVFAFIAHNVTGKASAPGLTNGNFFNRKKHDTTNIRFINEERQMSAKQGKGKKDSRTEPKHAPDRKKHAPARPPAVKTVRVETGKRKKIRISKGGDAAPVTANTLEAVMLGVKKVYDSVNVSREKAGGYVEPLYADRDDDTDIGPDESQDSQDEMPLETGKTGGGGSESETRGSDEEDAEEEGEDESPDEAAGGTAEDDGGGYGGEPEGDAITEPPGETAAESNEEEVETEMPEKKITASVPVPEPTRKLSLISERDWHELDRKTSPVTSERKREEKLRARDKLLDLFSKWENEVMLEDITRDKSPGESPDDMVRNQLIESRRQEEELTRSRELYESQKRLEDDKKRLDMAESARTREFFELKNKALAELKAKSDERLRQLEGELRSRLETEFKSRSLAEIKERTEEKLKTMENELRAKMVDEFRAREGQRLQEIAAMKAKFESDIKSIEERRQREFAELRSKTDDDFKSKEDERLKVLENEFRERFRKIQEKLSTDAKRLEEDKKLEIEKLRTQLRLQMDDEKRLEVEKLKNEMNTAFEDEKRRLGSALQAKPAIDIEKLKEVEARLREKFEADFKGREERRKEEFKLIKQQLIDELRSKENELKERMSGDALKRVEELNSMLNDVKTEKEGEIVRQSKIVNIQSALLFKIFEKDRKLFLRILEDANLSPEDLKKLMGGAGKSGGTSPAGTSAGNSGGKATGGGGKGDEEDDEGEDEDEE
jgi:hypothetical protein